MYSSSILLLLTALSAVPIQAVPLPAVSGVACPEDGAIVCSPDGQSFYMCNWGKTAAMGQVAAGTICKDGTIYAISTGQVVAGPGTPIPVMGSTFVFPSITASSSDESTTSAPATTTIPTPVKVKPTTSADQTTSTTIFETVQSTSYIIETRTRSAASPPVTSSASPVEAPSTPADSPTVAAPTETTPPTVAPTSSSPSSVAPSTGGLSTAQLLAIAPQSSTCSGAPFVDECSTADHAVSFINTAFSTYGITTKGEKAALISIMAFESGEFKYNINHYPGTPGQGTRNMMNFPFILQYAASISTLASQIPPGTTATSASDDVKNSVRALVLDDAHSFASAAWFLTTQCSAAVRSGLQSGTDESAWEEYITSCVGTTVTDARKAYWTAAVNAL